MFLQKLPLELLERVITQLALPDICSLRLTSKCLASNAAQKHLKDKFRAKKIHLTEQQLRTFVAVTASGGLACLVQDLTLVAPVHNTLSLTTRLERKTAKLAKFDDDGHFVGTHYRDLTDDELRRARLDLEILQDRLAEQLDMLHHERDVDLLRQAFSNLAAHGASLRMLRTEVEIYKDDTTTPLLPLFGGSEEPIWASTVTIGHTLFASLAACDLPIHSLNLFNSNRMLRCSMPCNGFNSDNFASGSLDPSLGHLKELSLRMSGKVIERTSGREVIEEVAHSSNFCGFQSMLQTCSNIRKLELAHFSPDSTPDANVLCGEILRTLSGSSLPCLRSLTLQGFRITEDGLLTLLRGFQALRSLSLCYIKLTGGSFKRILDYCTMEAAMAEVELESLFEQEIVKFEPPWLIKPSESGNPPMGYPDARASYRRPSDNASDCQIAHYVHHGRTVDSPWTKRWRQDLRNRFGPLPRDGKPSCLQPYVRAEETWRYR